MAILVDSNTKVICQASPALRAHFTPNRPSPMAQRWLAVSRPGKGGSSHLGLPVSTLSTTPIKRKPGANAMRSTCRRTLCRRCHSRGHRRGDPADCNDHRRHSGDGYGEGETRARWIEVPAGQGRTVQGSSHPANARSASCTGHIHKRGSVGIVSPLRHSYL